MRVIVDTIYQRGLPYMHRWILYLWACSLRVHHLRRSDVCDPHTHPWWFLSVILGRYTEELPIDPENPAGPTRRHARWFLNWGAPHRSHRVILDHGPVWTLVFTSPKVNSWGFHTPEGFVPWQDYRGDR